MRRVCTGARPLDGVLCARAQDCLHGNCAAAFVVTLRAEAQNLDECAATLRFAQRARAIPVVVRANVQVRWST